MDCTPFGCPSVCSCVNLTQTQVGSHTNFENRRLKSRGYIMVRQECATAYKRKSLQAAKLQNW